MLRTEKYTFFWKDKIAQWNKTSFKDNEGIIYNCAEQYMMAKKALLFNDLESYKEIMKEKEPKIQQDLGRKVKGFNKEIWDSNCIQIVYQGNIFKFKQNPELLEILLSTKGTILVEASPFDRIWGIGRGVEDILINDKEQWLGTNLLGYVLTNLRDNYFGNKEVIKKENIDMKLITKALLYASDKHKTQRRKGNDKNTPYINHPIDLFDILVRNEIKDENILCAAILHDVIEDTDGTYEEIESLFNKEIADIVLDCSDDKTLLKFERKLLQIEKTKYKSKKSLYVKIADKISNNRGFIDGNINWSEERIIGYILWSKSVVDTIKDTDNNLYNEFLGVYNTLKEMYKFEETKENLDKYINLIKEL